MKLHNIWSSNIANNFKLQFERAVFTNSVHNLAKCHSGHLGIIIHVTVTVRNSIPVLRKVYKNNNSRRETWSSESMECHKLSYLFKPLAIADQSRVRHVELSMEVKQK